MANMSAEPERAVIYTRISRDDSGEGAANERQEEACRQLAASRGWEVVAVERDVSISAWRSKDRPGWNRVVRMMKNGECDVVLAWKLDRVTRRIRDLVDLIEIANETNVTFATTDGMLDLSTPVGRAVATILGAVAQMEVELKGERTEARNLQWARKGEFRNSGFRPFGYTMEGEIVEKEAALIREASEDVLNGTPLRAIVRRWKELEVPTARSKKDVDGWTHNSVRRILLNPRNAGLATYKGEVVGKGRWEPIISEETHVLLVATLTDPARAKGEDKHLGNKPRNLLSGIATCGECGWKVEAGSRNGTKVYRCSNPEGDHLTTNRDEAEQVVRTAFFHTLGRMPGEILEPKEQGVPAHLWEERQRVEERMSKLASSWAESVLTDGQFEVASASLKAQLNEIDDSIQSAANQPELPRWEEAKRFLTLDMWGQRRMLESLAEIKLWPKNGKWNVPMRQQVTVHIADRSGQAITALDERNGTAPDPSPSHYEALADLLVQKQPRGVTTLREAARWLVDNRHTDRKPGGLPGQLSPRVKYSKGETRGVGSWTRKP